MKALISILMMVPGLALAGVVNGGGGKAIVCRGPDRTILTAQVLDLFEAENQYGLTLLPSAATFEENLSQVGKRLEDLSGTRQMFKMGLVHLELIHKKFKLLAPGVGIQPIDDSMDLIKPEGCEVEQLAFFKEANVILVNQDIWNKLDPRNQAALVVHETIYQLQRQRLAKDSRDSRKIVGHLFSTAPLENVMGIVPREGEAILCQAFNPTEYFYVSLNPEGQTELTFAYIDGQQVFSKTTAVLHDDQFYRHLLGEDLGSAGGYGMTPLLNSAIPHRLYERADVMYHRAPEDDSQEYIKVKIGYRMMDEMPQYPDNKVRRALYCFKETSYPGSGSATPIKRGRVR